MFYVMLSLVLSPHPTLSMITLLVSIFHDTVLTGFLVAWSFNLVVVLVLSHVLCDNYLSWAFISWLYVLHDVALSSHLAIITFWGTNVMILLVWITCSSPSSSKYAQGRSLVALSFVWVVRSPLMMILPSSCYSLPFLLLYLPTCRYPGFRRLGASSPLLYLLLLWWILHSSRSFFPLSSQLNTWNYVTILSSCRFSYSLSFPIYPFISISWTSSHL